MGEHGTILTLPWCILSGEEAEMSRPWVEARREVSTRERPGVMVRTLCSPQSRRHCSYPDNGHYLHLLRFPDTLTPPLHSLNFCNSSIYTDKTHIKRLGHENLPKMSQPCGHVDI